MSINPDAEKKAKRNRGADRPFPWLCRHCGKSEVVETTVDYDAKISHDGRVHEFTIPFLRVPKCQACGETVFTEKVDDQISDALREHLKLLTPAEMRAALDRLNLTQKDAAEMLGIAEATLSRWLTDVQIQSRAMDNLLRLFFDVPEARRALQRPKELERTAQPRNDRIESTTRERFRVLHGRGPQHLETVKKRAAAFQLNTPGMN